MTAEVLTTLPLETTQFLVITEDPSVSATFLISSILSKYQSSLLIPFQNTSRHYYHIGLKLGYNLDKSDFHSIEPLKNILQNFPFNLDTFYSEIESKITELCTEKDNVCVIIEDVSKLLELNVDLRQVIKLKQNLRNLGKKFQNLMIVVSVKVCTEEDQVAANAFLHVADSVVQLRELKTGASSVITGLMKIENGSGNSTLVNTSYHYKLGDRSIRLFAPGSV